MRIKIGQKDSVIIDFTNKLELIAFSDSPFEIFMTLVSVLYKKLYSKLNNFNVNNVTILIEIIIEFIKDQALDGSDVDDVYQIEDEMNGFEEANLKTSIKEYSVSLRDNVELIFNQGISQLKQKVLNSYNVIGSNWHLKRVINVNVSTVYNFNSASSISKFIF